MTWSEMITLNTNTSLDKSQIVEMFYQLDAPAPGGDLADIALLRAPGATDRFCIRLTWQGQIPHQGKSVFGTLLAEAFSEKGQACHTAWQREGSLVFMNREPIYPASAQGAPR